MSFFKPEDFNDQRFFFGALGAQIAERANAVLAERGVRVYGVEYDETGIYRRHTRPQDTHQALLVAIEELPKKECEHNGYAVTGLLNTDFKCQNCGIKLRAKWEPA